MNTEKQDWDLLNHIGAALRDAQQYQNEVMTKHDKCWVFLRKKAKQATQKMEAEHIAAWNMMITNRAARFLQGEKKC